jgi:geranylgeranyl pyrophosphate synthase
MSGPVSRTGDAAGEPAAQEVEAIEAIMCRGGSVLRERMVNAEALLEQVTSRSGQALAPHANATVRAGGKRLRPLLVMLAAEALGGPPETAEGELRLLRGAIAVELVHSATLVHDDVIDAANLRRGSPTVVAQAGRLTALATGDLLFSRAFAELARNEDLAQLRALSDASSALAEGELLQREDAYGTDVSLDRYLHRCELKTAALFEAACRLGVLLAGEGSDELADGLGTFARRIGLAFQLLDDVLDVSGPVSETGKSRGTDLLDGTVTMPLILARERDAELASLDLASLSGPVQAEEICDRIAATGALQESRVRALALVAQAKALLPTILEEERVVPLELVADAVVERYR